MLRRDLYAAEFFFLCAIRQAERRDIRYEAAVEKLASVRASCRRRTSPRMASAAPDPM
jgi:hypothetical protein